VEPIAAHKLTVRSPQKHRRAAQLEGMEQRLALSVSVSLVNGQSLVTGDNTNHTIALEHFGAPGNPAA
jgi:hypothetical protein